MNDEKRKHIDEFIKLVKEHPELPVIPMVSGEIVGSDEYAHWMGSFWKSDIREYAIDSYYGDGFVRYRDDYGAEEELVESIAEGKYKGTDEDYRRAKQEAEKLWMKAIILYIESPEE